MDMDMDVDMRHRFGIHLGICVGMCLWICVGICVGITTWLMLLHCFYLCFSINAWNKPRSELHALKLPRQVRELTSGSHAGPAIQGCAIRRTALALIVLKPIPRNAPSESANCSLATYKNSLRHALLGTMDRCVEG